MADVRMIQIQISTTVSSDSQGASQDTKPVDNNGNIKRNEKVLNSVLLNQAFNQAKNLTANAINSTLNRYLRLKEDYMAENTVNNIKTGVSKISSLALTTLAGAKLGGPIGAIISASGWTINEGINVANTLDATYRQIASSNYSTSFARTRAGLIDGGKGTEN